MRPQPTTKRCARCFQEKPVSEFTTRGKRPGWSCYCKPCERIRKKPYARPWYEANREAVIAQNARYRAEHRDQSRMFFCERRRDRLAAHPDKVHAEGRAYRAVRKALKNGALVRPDECESCKTKCKPDAAHHDYTKPLEVRWLCRGCHVRWDKAEPKAGHWRRNGEQFL